MSKHTKIEDSWKGAVRDDFEQRLKNRITDIGRVPYGGENDVRCELCDGPVAYCYKYNICKRCYNRFDYSLCHLTHIDFANIEVMMLAVFRQLPKHVQIAKILRDGPIDNWTCWGEK